MKLLWRVICTWSRRYLNIKVPFRHLWGMKNSRMVCWQFDEGNLELNDCHPHGVNSAVDFTLRDLIVV